MKFTETQLRSTPEYTSWLQDIKEKITRVQVRAALAASRELILFYWDLGESISRKLQENSWGKKVIDQLSKDLTSEFCGVQGFSRRNLYYVKKFYEFFSGFSDTEVIVPRGEAQMENEIDHPTIGILLCRDRNRIETEFALRDINKPMGVSEFSLTENLPENLKGSLPTIEEIEADFERLEKESV